MNKSSLSVAAEVRISPLWLIGPLAALGIPAIFIIELLSGALELRMVLFLLLFYVVLGVTWLLLSRNYGGGKWFFVIAFIGMICLGQFWWGLPELLILLVIPPVLAAVLMSLPAALLTAIGETVLLLVWSNYVVSDIRLATTTMVLATVWLTLIYTCKDAMRLRMMQ